MSEKFIASRNRLGNSNNRFQGDRLRVLCVCSAGLLRSPTAAWILSNDPFDFNTRAVGTSHDFALIPIDAAHVAWADEIVVMDMAQEVLIRSIEEIARLPESIVHVVNVPDNFGFRDPELVEMMNDIFLELFRIENKDSE